MGFYLELRPVAGSETRPEFREQKPPPVFWFLYFITGFALACMGAAAFTVLADLAQKGSAIDQLFLLTFLTAIPLYVALGIKLAGVRKYVRLDADHVEVGYRLFGTVVLRRRFRREDVRSVELVNRRPTPNVGEWQHGDRQYLVQGHWVLRLAGQGKKSWPLDRSTEKGTLEELHSALLAWRRV